MKNKKLYIIMTIGASLGLIASFLQVLEKLALLSGHRELVCDINSVFSCSAVLGAWQSSLFGFPNSLLCMVFFTYFLAVGLVGAMGSKLSLLARKVTLVVALGVLTFGVWFLLTSIFVIGAVCLFCLVCFTGLLLVTGSTTRLIAPDIKAQSFRKMVIRDIDIILLILLAVIIGSMIILRFY